jgi:phosphoribosylformylglycinamidine cyclo-ligase
MGHRMEIYLPAIEAEKIIQISGQFKIDAKIIGHCDESKGTSLIIHYESGEIYY